MKITDISFQVMNFPFVKPFRVAFTELAGMETCIVKVETDAGVTGYGEAAPLAFVTGDNLDTIVAVGNAMKPVLIGADPLAVGRIHVLMDGLYAGNTAVKAGIDIACYDIAAKSAGVPLYRYLGGDRTQIETDVTVGIQSPEDMAAEAAEWKEKGFRILKIKLGEDPVQDEKRIAAVRKAAGGDCALRVDANQGWTVKEAVRMSSVLERYGVDLLEQPVAAWDIGGLKEVRENSRIDVAADESCHVPQDAFRLAAERAVDVVNIKLMKCGGIYRALQINAVCEAAGIRCMIGCMGESPLANAAAMHLAAAAYNIRDIDLDSDVILKHENMRAGFVRDGGILTLTDDPGIGFAMEGI
jgi:L-alanine-DL-glutamate epimerase-like enolase superfamily enzyme